MADVRRAYRLVWAHQRRVIDMVKAIVSVFPESRHYYWEPIGFNKLPRSSTDPLNKWAWDALPYYDVSWLRVAETTDPHLPMKGRWMLQIRHQADDGWIDSDRSRIEPDARKFKPAEDAVSDLTIILWKSEVDPSSGRNWLQASTIHPEWPEADYDSKITDPESGLRAVAVSKEISSIHSVEVASNLAHEVRRRGREELQLDLPDLLNLSSG